MNDARAITADFASLKWVNGRKVLQVICEVPSERAGEVLSILGNPTGEGIPVAIAVLDIQPDVKKDLAKHAEIAAENNAKNAQEFRRKYEDLPYSQQAALLCKNNRFLSWASAEMNVVDGGSYVYSNSQILDWFRNKLGITSRSELDDVNKVFARGKFENLRDEYHSNTGSYPEQRG